MAVGTQAGVLVGDLLEDTAAALRLIVSRVLERFPAIRFIVPHLGETIPFPFARVIRKSDDRIAQGLRSLYHDTVSGSPDALTCSCQAFGPERLLFGTDYPCCDEEQFAHHLGCLDQAKLEPHDLEAIRGATASELLDLDSRPEGWR